MKPVVHALIKKRAEIAGRIEAIHAEAARLVCDLDYLDQCIRIFEPQIDFSDLPIKPLPPPNATFRGEFSRSLLEMLRGTQHWQTTDQLALKVMVVRRMNDKDLALRRSVRVRVGEALARLRRKGMVTCKRFGKEPGRNALLSWRITKPDDA